MEMQVVKMHECFQKTSWTHSGSQNIDFEQENSADKINRVCKAAENYSSDRTLQKLL